MKINEKTALLGEKVALVPYLPEHVPKYHEWMQSPHLQEATASEPLTLEEEYAMQRSWREDEDKCTFIVLDKARYLESGDLVGPMVGDVNLFFNDYHDKGCAEAEIMIAEPAYRMLGYGREALVLMLQYGASDLNVTKYVAKIGRNNETSLKLFEKLGFTLESISEVFNEVTLEYPVAPDSPLLLSPAPCTRESLP